MFETEEGEAGYSERRVKGFDSTPDTSSLQNYKALSEQSGRGENCEIFSSVHVEKEVLSQVFFQRNNEYMLEYKNVELKFS